MTADETRRRDPTDAPAIVPATAVDVPAVVELIARVYGEYGFVCEPRVEWPDLFDFDAHYAPPRGAFFVVRAAGGIVGSVGVERLDERAAELHRLYLDAALRGRGTGRALTERALAWCRARGIGHVILWSDTRFDLAHRLYTRMGFTRTGERVLPDDPNDSREYRFERPVR
jgi:GNAT superfamily N-acetyltransferase